MGWRRFWPAALAVASFQFAPLAHAETAEDKAAALVAEGEALGKAGKYDQALERFRRAEAIAPNAVHDCFMAIALTRQQSLTRARFFLERCKRRSEQSPPVPWYEEAHGQLVASMMDHGKLQVIVAASDTDVVAAARIEIRGFEDLPLQSGDAVFLPAGRHRVTVRHNGYKIAKQQISIAPDEPLKVTATLVRETPESVVRAEPRVAARKTPVAAYTIYGAAGIALVAGVAFHINGAMARSDAIDANERRDEAAYEVHRDRIVVNRAIAVSLYSVGALSAAVATYLLLRDRNSKSDSESLAVSVAVDNGAGAIAIGGRF